MKKTKLSTISLIGVGLLAFTACGPKGPTKPEKVTNLAVNRIDDNNVEITFDVKEGLTYEVSVDQGTAADITSGAQLNLILKQGSYTIQVRAKDSSKQVSDWADVEHTMTHLENERGEGVSYTIWKVDEKPYGTGTLNYDSGDVFVGTLAEDWSRKEGKLTYANNMYYEGKFVNDQFEDTDGVFSWQTTPGDGWVYEGGFVGGTIVDQIGDLYLTDYFKKTAVGIWALFGAKMDAMPGYAANQTTESSKYVTWFGDANNYNWYEGPINIDGSKAFNTTGLTGTLSIGRRLVHGSGLQYWTGTMRSDFWPTTDTIGYGEIQFGGGNYEDWFEGSILHAGDGDTWVRHGVGTERWSIVGHPDTKDAQFTWAWQNASQAFKDEMARLGCMQDKITAVFDKDFGGGWINGDGYWYILDNQGNPYGYVSGKWSGSVDRVGNISDGSVVTLDPAYANALDLTALWVQA